MNIESTRTIDALIVLAYLIVSFGLGIMASRIFRTKQANEEDYFLAGRKVPGWLSGVSYAVTSMNSDVAPTYCGFAVVVGLPIAWFYLSRFGVAILIATLLFAARWRQLGISTGPEFFSLRFGGQMSTFARVYSSLYTVAITMVPWIGAGLLGVHRIFGPIFSIEELWVTLSCVLPLLFVYVWISGFSGVLITDLLQSVIIVVAMQFS